LSGVTESSIVIPAEIAGCSILLTEGGFWARNAIAQRKGAQPLRVVGRQKRVFARVPGGKPARTNHIIG